MRSKRYAVVVAVLLAATSAVRADTVTVFAAASLADAFRSIGHDFEAAHADTKVVLSFAGSSTLVRQITEGAPADVLATAVEDIMQKLVAAGGVDGAPRVFVRSRLAIVVAKGNPKRVTRLADLARPGLTIALAAPAVPAGRYAVEAFKKAGVPPPAATNEADVKADVTRVASGDADAGVVYVTDVAAGGPSIEDVAIADAENVVARYPIATLKGAPNAAGARAFVEYVLSAPAQQELATAGFLAP
jgi:molybdate transport system substrate-binding protein